MNFISAFHDFEQDGYSYLQIVGLKNNRLSASAKIEGFGEGDAVKLLADIREILEVSG